jgi:hypothetical protein
MLKVCPVTTSLLLRAIKNSVHINEPERTLRYLELLRLKNASAGHTVIRTVVQSLVNKGT